MVRITKVYTKQGDAGTTSLAGGIRVPKDHPRVVAYGTIDELNAVIGASIEAGRHHEAAAGICKKLLRIQNELFDLGSQLAVVPSQRRENTPVIGTADIERLEAEIDAVNDDLPPLKSFILPGGGPLSTWLHLARTVCRRAERETFAVGMDELDGPELGYLNRLSDWLFVYARCAASSTDNSETLWRPGER